jgi:hypothetical protein
VEFWNGGYVFTSQRNCVAAQRIYPRNHIMVPRAEKK